MMIENVVELASFFARPGRLFVVSVLLIVSPLISQSQPTATRIAKPDFSTTRKLIEERMTAESIPSVAVAVARNGEILWEEGFGWADRENRIPATEHTMYYLASVTKAITGTAIMMLHDRKQLDLDHPINDYLGPARLSSPRWDVNGATVRRVAMHTAGLT